MIPSPHGIRNPAIDLPASQERVPSIIVHVDTGTSVHLLHAVRMAIQELRDYYGIHITYEIANDTILTGATGLGIDSTIIEILGKHVEVADYDYLGDPDEYVNKVKTMLIAEVLRNIGASSHMGEWFSFPSSTRGSPSAPEAVFVS